MALAQEWQRLINSGQLVSGADLARQLGVSRAHVTQTLRLLRMTPRATEAILALGDPMKGRFVGAHTLRSLSKLPAEEQGRRVEELVAGRPQRA